MWTVFLGSLALSLCVYWNRRQYLMKVYKYLRCGRQRDKARLLSVVCGNRTGGSSHKLEHRKFCRNMYKDFFTVRVTEHWNRLLKDCGVSSGDVEDLPGCLPVQPGLGNLLCRGLDYMISRGPFQPLQLCDSVILYKLQAEKDDNWIGGWISRYLQELCLQATKLNNFFEFMGIRYFPLSF